LYCGVLDNDPGQADGLALRPGAHVTFAAEHIIAIARPPDGYVLERYGAEFFRT
jgi:hypothetical protein